jgi:hypothetical protein
MMSGLNSRRKKGERRVLKYVASSRYVLEQTPPQLRRTTTPIRKADKRGLSNTPIKMQAERGGDGWRHAGSKYNQCHTRAGEMGDGS